jgi:hypothetical protein
MRLVQKLEGGKKRARNVENGRPPAAIVEGVGVGEGDGDDKDDEDGVEEMTRGGSGARKRTRVVDPFEPGGKNKKKMKKVMTEAAPTPTPAEDVTLDEELLRLAGTAVAVVDATTSASPKKKKRKKKKNMETEREKADSELLPPENQGTQEVRVPLGGFVVGEPRSADCDHGADIALRSEISAQPRLDDGDGLDGLRKHQKRSRSATPAGSSSSHPGMCVPHLHRTRFHGRNAFGFLLIFFCFDFELPYSGCTTRQSSWHSTTRGISETNAGVSYCPCTRSSDNIGLPSPRGTFSPNLKSNRCAPVSSGRDGGLSYQKAEAEKEEKETHRRPRGYRGPSIMHDGVQFVPSL